MATDDLNAPLGQNTNASADASRLPLVAPQAIAGVLGAVARCLSRSGPLVRRRSARRRADRRSSPTERPPAADRPRPPDDGAHAGPRQTGRHASQPLTAPAAAATTPAAPPGTDRHHHRRLERQAPGGRDSRHTARRPRTAAAPVDQRLLEAVAPRRHPEDRARRRAPGRRLCPRRPRRLPAKPDAPRIAIVVGGLGISASGTADALGKLPGAGDASRSRPTAPISSARRRARAAKATRCCCRCRWSRSTIPTTIPARRRC